MGRRKSILIKGNTKVLRQWVCSIFEEFKASELENRERERAGENVWWERKGKTRYDFGYKPINKEKTVKDLTSEEFKRRESDQIYTIRTLFSVQCGNWEKEGQGTTVNSPLKAITVTWAEAEGLHSEGYRRHKGGGKQQQREANGSDMYVGGDNSRIRNGKCKRWERC